MNDSLLFTGVAFVFVALAITIIKADRKPTYVIKYLQGRYVIIETKTDAHLMWFVTFEDAQDWFNKNCL
jgi:hypothetical protein